MLRFNIIGFSFLFLVFFIEFIILFLHRPNKNMVKDTLTNCSLGLCLILFGFFEKIVAFSFLSLVYHYAIFTPKLSWWFWIIGFLSYDFIFYAQHWIAHKTRIFWAAHVTHHSSKFFNLSIAWRINFIQLFYRFLYWTPLCYFGFPPEMVLLIESITSILNFLVHTEKVGKLGILDWIFNTPSNHRVHHASNPEYIDKNLGGIFMIYDHLFGTYARETTPPIYGITHDVNTNNPFNILFNNYIWLTSESLKIKGLKAKFRFLFSNPQ